MPEAGYKTANPIGAVNPSKINTISCGICESVVGQVDSWSSTLKTGCVANAQCQTVKYDCNIASNSIIYNSPAAAMAGGFADDKKTCCCFCSCNLVSGSNAFQSAKAGGVGGTYLEPYPAAGPYPS